MNDFLKIATLAATCSIAALLLKRTGGALDTGVRLAGCCAVGFLLLTLAEPVLAFLKALASAASIDQDLLQPMLKAAGVGLLTQYSAATCADAGESALSKLVETGGCLLCLCLALPMMTKLLELVRGMMGG